MTSKTVSLIKNKLKKYLKDDQIFDIILFGSLAKGKIIPGDIDVAIITDKDPQIKIDNFHISIITPRDFFVNRPTIVNTLLREGYSIKYDAPFSKLYSFSSKAMYTYTLSNLKPSQKVRAVNILRGIKDKKGIVEEQGGEWIANQVFTVPVSSDSIIDRLMTNLKIKFKKYFLLIH